MMMVVVFNVIMMMSMMMIIMMMMMRMRVMIMMVTMMRMKNLTMSMAMKIILTVIITIESTTKMPVMTLLPMLPPQVLPSLSLPSVELGSLPPPSSRLGWRQALYQDQVRERNNWTDTDGRGGKHRDVYHHRVLTFLRVSLGKTSEKIPQSISRPMRIVAPIPQ